MIVEQISIFLENKTGRLVEVTKALADAGVNIRALSLADTSDFGILRLIVDKPEESLAALHEKGMTVSLTDVIAVQIIDEPGGFAKAVKPRSSPGFRSRCPSATGTRVTLPLRAPRPMPLALFSLRQGSTPTSIAAMPNSWSPQRTNVLPRR